MDIKEAIQRLQSIDAKDLKNLDLSQIKESLLQKRENLIIFVLIVGSISATIYFYANFNKKSEMYHSEIDVLQKQLDAAGLAKTAQTEYSDFTKNFPQPILITDLRDKLTAFALQRNIKILAFTPEKNKQTDYFNSVGISLRVSSDNYQSLIEFIKDLEDAPYSIRINEMSAKLQEQHLAADGQQLPEIIEANISLELITLKL